MCGCVCAQVLSYVWLSGSTRRLCSRDFPGENTGVGCHFLLQGIFLTQGKDLHLLNQLHQQADSLSLSPPALPLVAQKRLPAMQEAWVQSLGQEDPCRRQWQPTPAFLPGESHGQRSLAGYSPWVCKESDTTEWLTHTQHAGQPLLHEGGPWFSDCCPVRRGAFGHRGLTQRKDGLGAADRGRGWRRAATGHGVPGVLSILQKSGEAGPILP